MTLFLLLTGLFLLFSATLYLFRDCVRGYGYTMGGEMTFCALWFVGGLILSAGLYLKTGINAVWCVGAWVAVCAFSFPFRRVVERLGNRYGRRN